MNPFAQAAIVLLFLASSIFGQTLTTSLAGVSGVPTFSGSPITYTARATNSGGANQVQWLASYIKTAADGEYDFTINLDLIANEAWIYNYRSGNSSWPRTAVALGTYTLNPPLAFQGITITSYTLAKSGNDVDFTITIARDGTWPGSKVIVLGAYNGSIWSQPWTYTAAANWTTTADNVPPAVSITQPANNQAVSGIVTVTATASDNVGVTSVQFKLDGGNLGSPDTTAPYSVSWDTSGYSGSHTLTAVAVDAANNSATSAGITVTVSGGATLTTSLVGVTGVPTFSGSPITYTARATNSGGANQVQWLASIVKTAADGENDFGIHLNPVANEMLIQNYHTGQTTWPRTPVSLGTYTLSPPLTLNGITVNSYTLAKSGNNVDFTVTVARDSSWPGSKVIVLGASNGSIYSQPWTYTAVAIWTTGTPDNVPPTVSITSPTNNQTVSGTIAVTATASDNVGVASVQFKLDGGNLGSPDTTAPYSVSWNSSAYSGSHALTAVAIDAANNSTTSAAVTVTVSGGSGIPITVTSAPPGRSLTVDSNPSTAPCSFQWAQGSSHTIAVIASVQSGTTGTQFVFVNWSDSGAQSHTITASAAATYTANFTTQYFLTTSSNPPQGGTINPPSGWYASGTVVSVSATPTDASWTFTGFSGALSGTTTPQSLTVSAPLTVTANFVDPIISLTTSPMFLQLRVDGQLCTGGSNCVFIWATGSTHTIEAISPQQLSNTPYVFSSWSDGGAQTHSIIVTPAITTYTANFNAQNGNCYTFTYGGVNGNPSDTGVSVGMFSSTYRLNGNEVYMQSYTSVSGPNAGLVRPNITTYYYRNNTLFGTRSVTSPTYGTTVYGDQSQTLYSFGQYSLGTFQLGKPIQTGFPNDHSGTSPICESFYPQAYNHYYDSSNTYVATKPTILGPGNSTSASIWYLGGAPSIDGYFTQTLLTGNPNWSGPSGPPPVYWQVIQRPDKASLSASVASQVTITSQGANASMVPGTHDYDVLVQVSTDGLSSDPFPLSINASWSVSGVLDLHYNWVPEQGFVSRYVYRMYDVSGFQINAPITLHETIENCKVDYPSTNWCEVPISIDTWTPSDWVISGGEWVWVDNYAAYGFLFPAPQYPQIPPGTAVVINKTQKFFVGAAGVPGGSGNIFTGLCVQRNKIQFYLDHGDKQVVITPIPAALCALGAYAN